MSTYLSSLIFSLLGRLQNLSTQYIQQRIRRSLASCGKNVSFQIPICIEGADQVKIGHRVSIAAFVHIWGQGSVEIGDDTLIASHVAITSLTHDTNASLFSESLIAKPIIIGKNVWIGSHATILPGVQIGNSAIVAAGAVVTKNVDANTIVAGVPARLLRSRLPNNVNN